MIDIELVRAHEDELEQQVARLLDLANSYSGPPAAYGLNLQLTRLIGCWRRLLMWRDRLVYRPLASSDDDEMIALGLRCHDRMLVLGERIEGFAIRWSSSVLIATEFPRFRAEIIALTAAMQTRFDGDRALLGLSRSATRGATSRAA